MRRIFIISFLLLLFLNPSTSVSAAIPSEVKKAVAFIYTFEEKKATLAWYVKSKINSNQRLTFNLY